MKKIQVLFAMFAIIAASAGVYATEVKFIDRYYEDTAAPDLCDVEISNPCTIPGGDMCKSSHNLDVYVSENEIGCEQVTRPFPTE